MYIDRRNTNAAVLQKANDAVNHSNYRTHKVIEKISEVLKQNRLKLLGHVIRASPKDPMREVTFETASINIKRPAYRRVGRPRIKWIDAALEEAWSYACAPTDSYDNNNLAHNQKIMSLALSRQKPFQKSKAEISKDRQEFVNKRRTFDEHETQLFRRNR